MILHLFFFSIFNSDRRFCLAVGKVGRVCDRKQKSLKDGGVEQD